MSQREAGVIGPSGKVGASFHHVHMALIFGKQRRVWQPHCDLMSHASPPMQGPSQDLPKL